MGHRNLRGLRAVVTASEPGTINSRSIDGRPTASRSTAGRGTTLHRSLPSKEHHVPPLTRRIARAALLVAAGAAAGVGAAKLRERGRTAGHPDLGGLTALDNAGTTVDGAAQNATGLAGDAGSKAVKKAVPTAGKTSGKAVKTTTPAAQKTAGDAAGTAGEVLGDAAGATGGGLPGAGQLPLQGLPLG